jgi:hypothetical protein
MIVSMNTPSLSAAIPEFIQLTERICQLGEAAWFTAEQSTHLREAIHRNAAAYSNPEKDYRGEDITPSGLQATKPMHHMCMVFLNLYTYTQNIGDSKRLFPTSDQLFSNCLVLLFHDFVEDKKILDKLPQEPAPVLDLLVKKDSALVAETLRTDKRWSVSENHLYSIQKRTSESRWGGYEVQKDSLLSLFQYFLHQKDDPDFATQCCRRIWLMSRVYLEEEWKVSYENCFQRLCHDDILVFNKVLDYITNTLGSRSLRVGLVKKQLGAELLATRNDQIMERIIPFLPELVRQLEQFIRVESVYTDVLTRHAWYGQTFRGLLDLLLKDAPPRLAQ